MGESVKLKGPEDEFVAEMRDTLNWQSFDPDFRQADIARLFRRGWFEKRGTPRFREYRWTDAGRAALPPTETPNA